MDIERVNDYTVKFFISYNDMEDRGYSRDEIWYNREKGEELFWDMLDEVNMEEDFMIEGPLWIQVQAFDQGLEITVTKAQISRDGSRFELPISFENPIEIPVDENIEEILDEKFNINSEKRKSNKVSDEETSVNHHFTNEVLLDFVIKFADFEDLISLSYDVTDYDFDTKLFVFENRYYLTVHFEEDICDEDQIDTWLTRILEFGEESPVTVHRLEEYGKCIMENTVFESVRTHFKPKMN